MEEKIINLDDLKKEIPFKWRVQSFSKYKAVATCVAYIDSRQVQDLLDEVCGPENWQDKYYECKGNLFCSIGIKFNGEWIWKSDCGVESNVDKEKGEASDSFKRAAVKFGVGRFLYSQKMMYLPANDKKSNSNWVVDDKGKRVFDLTEHINSLGGNQPKISKEQNVKNDDNKISRDQWQTFYQQWDGKTDGKTVLWNNTKYELDKDQLAYISKFPKHPAKS